MAPCLKRELKFEIRKDNDGRTMLDFLTIRFPYHTKEEWRKLVESGKATLNESLASCDSVLKTGDLMEYEASDIPEPPVPLSIEIVFQDDDILVVNKPAGLPCHPGGRFFNHTLWAVLITSHEMTAPAFVNRLDRETSGLVLVARNEEAAKSCRTQFARRSVEKTYVALVAGAFPSEVMAVGRLEPDPNATIRKKSLFIPARPGEEPDTTSSKWAETGFRLIARHADISEIEIHPKTGRLHQIRATLEAMGHPVIGDKLYGAEKNLFLRFCKDQLTEDDVKFLRIGRQALHAAGLRLLHPRKGTVLAFKAPMPADMLALIRDAGGHSSDR